MPCLEIRTNISVEQSVASALILDASRSVATAMGKPEQYMMITFLQAQAMCLNASEAPCAFVELNSIGFINAEMNANVAGVVAGLLEKHLNIPSDRLFMNFRDVPAVNWAIGANTVG